MRCGGWKHNWQPHRRHCRAVGLEQVLRRNGRGKAAAWTVCLTEEGATR